MRRHGARHTSATSLPISGVIRPAPQREGCSPNLGDLLTARPVGLTEPESWAVLCQAVQALQDLFLSDGAFGGSCIPLVTPNTLQLSARGRVYLQQSGAPAVPAVHLAGYLAPEYRPHKTFTDTEAEKMWIHALGETLKRATLTSHAATSRLSSELCQVLTDMTRPQANSRASLMYLLDVISEYCKRRQQTRPFSHIVMDLHQEALAAVEAALETPWGPPAMPELRTITRNSTDLSLPGGATRRWPHHLPRSPAKAKLLTTTTTTTTLTREASTSMEDLTLGGAVTSPSSHHYALPGSVLRPKSLCIPELAGGYDNTLSLFQQNRPLPSMVIPTKLASTTSVTNLRYKCKDNIRLPTTKITTNSNTTTRRNPVQRAASRLYRAGTTGSETGRPVVTGAVPSSQVSADYEQMAPVSVPSRDCVGPEFVVRAALPSRQLVMGGSATDGKANGRKLVTVILLNGQKIDVLCNPSTTTSGQLFELIIQKEHIEENFMLGLSALIAGDFVFLPSDTRICKALPSGNNSATVGTTLTLFMRVRFFLPSLRGVRGRLARHLLYLQLRRAILEHQLPCSYNQLVALNGFALQAEFGDFNEREHGTRDYFLLEHYVPETMSSVFAADNGDTLKRELIKMHKFKKGLDGDKAEEDFIQLAQTLPHYGGHFYTATWTLKDNTQKDVWLYVSAQGINIYERSNISTPCGPMLYESFEWRSIQTLCYSKHYLCVLPHSAKMHTSKLKKYKLKMNHKKSYFTFRLASLHHQFFLRLRTEFTSLQSLSQQFGIPLKDIKNETNSLYKLEALTKPLYSVGGDTAGGSGGSVRAETEFKIEFRASSTGSNEEILLENQCRRSKSVNDFLLMQDEQINEDFQNKENENPYCKVDLLRNHSGLILDSGSLSGLGGTNVTTDKRRGVKMGISSFSGPGNRICRSMEAVNVSIAEDLEEMSLQSVSIHCSEASIPKSMEIGGRNNEAYILESTIKSCDNQFLPDFQESLSETLLEKLDNISFAEERSLRSVVIGKDIKGSLGMQITEGSDGKVYIQSVIAGGPAYKTGSVFSGDQIIAVNGQNLLSYKYDVALDILKNTQKQVEFILSQIIQKPQKPKSPYTKLNARCDLSNINESHVKSDKFKRISMPFAQPECANNSVEKYLTENCHDRTNLLKHATSTQQLEVPYHKHIRYEIENENDNFQGISTKNLNPHQRKQMNRLNKNGSKSCTHIAIGGAREKVTPNSLDNNQGIYQRFQTLDRKISVEFDSGVSEEEGHAHDGQLPPPIALPRSLGLSRKWRGNVRYPVTPVKKAFSPIETDISTYSSLSDEEQVFI